MRYSRATALSHPEIIDEIELARRLKTTADSVRWMRRSGRISFLKIAGNRKVRFVWPEVLEELRAREVKARPTDERARQLADLASSGDEDNAECAAADLAREFPAAGT